MNLKVEWLKELDTPRVSECLPAFLAWMEMGLPLASTRAAVQQGWLKVAEQGSDDSGIT